MLTDFTPAILVLADGTVFPGASIGVEGHSVGEVVFNTSMTGYQELLTDPSYFQQLITLTYPHIGNVGCNELDNESLRVWASGLIIRDISLTASNWRSNSSLEGFLKAQNVVAISDVDTRALTHIIRDTGAQGGCILAGEKATSQASIELALEKARGFSGLNNTDLAKTASITESVSWRRGSWRASDNTFPELKAMPLYRVVAYDFGVKHNILRLLADRGCDITLVPAQTPAQEVLALSPDGVFLSNGPGDPAPCDYAISAIETFLEKRIPLFGICLGMQLLSLASGAKTTKMKFGHHGANHPVQDLDSQQVYITSQNHGFCVDEDSLPEHLQVTHRSLFDGTLQGVAHRRAPAFGFQGHPEAAPGPHDIQPLFDRFIKLMQQAKE